MSLLTTPLKVGDLVLPHRLIMAPLTRCRASGEGRVPNELMAEYYAQRSSAALIITEATSVCPMGVGYPRTPGIWSKEQVEGWKKVTERVHEKGGRIFLQLWHVGRVSDPYYLGGNLPVAPSAIAPLGEVSLLNPKRNFVTPRALELREIPEVIKAYVEGAKNAQRAGFDGVEIHGANGYLLDQFLQDSSNKRSDEYGGSLKNRARLMLEVTDAVIGVWGAGRVGMHLAPRGDAHSMGDSDLLSTFRYVSEELGKRKIAFICARSFEDSSWIVPELKKAFKGVFIINERFTPDSAEKVIERGEADAVAFGQLYISNPDLYERVKERYPLNPSDPKTFYTDGALGYTDYPIRKKLEKGAW